MARAVVLKSRPDPQYSLDDLAIEEWPERAPGEGEVRVRVEYLSPDPYMRGRMNDTKSYVPPYELAKPIAGFAVGTISESRNPQFKEGQTVTGVWPWIDSITLKPDAGEHFSPLLLRPVDGEAAPLSAYLGILGMPGSTAWVGLKLVGEPKAGETLFVSAASGAVGSAVGQIGKILGCRVVGSAGSAEKVNYLTGELGFDAAFNYREAGDFRAVLKETCPDGIDINFENVGGEQSMAVFRHMNSHGRFILCGLISAYDPPRPEPGPSLSEILIKSIRLQGFIVSGHPGLMVEWMQQGAAWLNEGKISYRETVKEGIESVPGAFKDLLTGGNFGKLVVRL